MHVRLVDVVPAALADETRQDSEASLAVNPLNPDELALSAFTPDPAGSGQAPIFVSTDGGRTWTLVVCLPGGDSTDDTSLRFGAASGLLYAAILRKDTGRMQVLRAASFPPRTTMTTLVERAGPDQPWVEVTRGAALGRTRDQVYVSANLGTAVAQFALDGSAARRGRGFGPMVDLESRNGPDRPSVRTAAHRSGVVYATFMRLHDERVDVVVARDDDGGALRWTSLVDPDDARPGRRVAVDVPTPGPGALLGSVRVSSRLAMAVDPNDADRLYLAWCDGKATPDSPLTLRLRRSDDGGRTWTGDLRRVPDVTNPALAVTLRGTVGMLYQHLARPARGDRWETHLETSDDGFATVREDLLIADLRDRGGTFQPTIGDFASLVAAGKDLHGAFCGFNRPSPAAFPHGVSYQRPADWDGRRLLGRDGITVRAPSIDPFYVHVTDVPADVDVSLSRHPGDSGVEPAGHPVLWTADCLRTLPAGGGRVGPPDGTSMPGANWVEVRVRRRAAGPALSARLRLLVAAAGIGTEFAAATTARGTVRQATPVRFAAGADTAPGVSLTWWRRPDAPARIRFALELESDRDPLGGPSLHGRAPGWPARPYELADDNNRAVRNVVSASVPLLASDDDAGTLTLVVLVRNAADHTREIVLDYRVDLAAGALVGAPRCASPDGRNRALATRGQVRTTALRPGDTSWLAVTMRPTGRGRRSLTIDMVERRAGADADGIRLEAVPAGARATTRFVIARQDAVVDRIAATGVDTATHRSAAHRSTLERWASITMARWPNMRALLEGAAGPADPLRVGRSCDLAERDLRRSPRAGLVSVLGVLERTDAAMSLHRAGR